MKIAGIEGASAGRGFVRDCCQGAPRTPFMGKLYLRDHGQVVTIEHPLGNEVASEAQMSAAPDQIGPMHPSDPPILAPPSGDDDVTRRSDMIAAISSSVGRLVREYTGRGPTRVRTRIAKDEVFVVMEDILTTGERRLVQTGQQDPVLELRSAYQIALREALIQVVEDTVGRKVVAFLSADHLDPDIAVESFILGETLS